MDRPVKKNIEYYNWGEVETYINDKYQLDLDDIGFWDWLCDNKEVSNEKIFYIYIDEIDLVYNEKDKQIDEAINLLFKEFGTEGEDFLIFVVSW